MLSSLLLTLAIAPARAEEPVEAAEASEDAAEKERRGGQKRAPAAAPQGDKRQTAPVRQGERPGLRESPQERRAEPPRQSEPREAPSDRGAAPEAERERSTVSPRSAGPIRSDVRPGERRMERDGREPEGRESEGREPEGRGAEGREPRADGGRESSHASADRRPPGHASTGGHAPANYRGHVRAASRHAGRHGATHHASAHAAWVDRHRHSHAWHSAWRPGYPHYWYHGVFVYGPRPVAYASGERRAAQVDKSPKRDIEHAGDLSVGIRGGSYLSSYDSGASYGDAGLGVAARYRFVDPLGVELAWTYHDATWDSGSERIQQPISASMQLFGFAWTHVNPYALAGVTVTPRNVNDEFASGEVDTDKTLWGPHGGVGLDINLSKNTSINFDLRFIGYLNKEDGDLSLPGAMQANMGANFYF